MKKQFTILAIAAISFTQAQNIAINSTGALPNASAVLDVDAAPANNKGLLVPRLQLSATNVPSPITSPANSLLVFNLLPAGSGSTAVVTGYYYWDAPNTRWLRLQATNSTASDWNLLGNTGTTPTTNFLGTIDNAGLVFRTNNIERVRVTAAGNVGIGAAPAAPAILELNASNKGFLMPRVALTSNIDAITVPSPVIGLQVYNTNFSSTLSKGICYWDGTTWLNVSTFIPAGSAYFAQVSAFTVLNNGNNFTIPFGSSTGTITVPESGVYQANIRTFAVPLVSGGSAGLLPLDQTAFYYTVFVNGVIIEEVEFYTFRTQVIATSGTLRYSANVGDIVTFRYRVAVGYSLDFISSFAIRNNVVISKVQ